QGLLAEIQRDDAGLERLMSAYSPKAAADLRKRSFDPDALAKTQMRYEKLDQMVQELLLGVR
ncbi:xylose isomerase, partial [Candidatus Sumerlaeota bacterium]|nr:xylose isomerase [Candidatus Sumerlaeota bacterium]